MRIIINVSAIVVHEPCQDRKVAALSEFAMCADFLFWLFVFENDLVLVILSENVL